MGLEDRNNKQADAGDHDPDENSNFLNSQSSETVPESNPAARQLLKQTPMMVIIFAMMGLSCLVLYHSSFILPFSGSYNNPFNASNRTANSSDNNHGDLKSILKNAAMGDNTVIITSLNDAWAEPESIFDLLLESFRIGNQTKRFLKHLVVICLDQKAYVRCLELHPHCYKVITNGTDFSGEASFMAADYLKIVWRKIDLMRMVLNLGYSFVFTDADIVWFRDPFSQFHKDADIQVSCDNFNGNSSDLRNAPNTGFSYVKSNEKTIQFYNLWYNSRITYPRLHDQDAFNRIKFDPFIKNVGLEMRFFDTTYFGGFCQPSQDLNKVCTMHANCCVGLDNKVHDLGILLDDWRRYTKSLINQTTPNGYQGSWTAPQFCRGSLHRPYIPKKRDGKGKKS